MLSSAGCYLFSLSQSHKVTIQADVIHGIIRLSIVEVKTEAVETLKCSLASRVGLPSAANGRRATISR